jgi:hypothetical protein
VAHPYAVQVRDRTYTVVDDQVIVLRALITGSALDELTQQPVPVPLAVVADRAGLTARVVDNSLFCLTGRPELLFPDLAHRGYTVQLTLSADGYLDTRLTVDIPQNARFPVQVPPVPLRRQPIRLQGRVVQDRDDKPIQGASVTLMDRHRPPSAPPLMEHLVAVREPLRKGHPRDVLVRPMKPDGPGKSLTVEAPAGTAEIVLDNRVGLAPGDVLQIGAGIVEYAIIDALLGQPGQVRLKAGLGHDFLMSAPVQKMVAASPPTTLNREAFAGEGVLFLRDLVRESVVAVDGLEVEYRALGTVTDADGYYRLDGIGRVGTVYVRAAAGRQQRTTPWVLIFGQPANVVNFRL